MTIDLRASQSELFAILNALRQNLNISNVLLPARGTFVDDQLAYINYGNLSPV